MSATQRTSTGRSAEFADGSSEVKAFFFATPDDSDVAVGSNSMAQEFGFGQEVSRWRAALESAATGDDLEFNILIKDPSDGSTVATLGPFTIPAGDTLASGTFTPQMVQRLETMKPDVTQVGSTLPGTGLSITID